MKYLFIASLLASNFALAALPDYQPAQILARANIRDGYNLPPLSFLNSTSPIINDRGDVAFKLLAVEGVNNQALWVKSADEENGKILYVAPDERYLTEPEAITENGKIAFNLYDEGVTDGLFLLDIKSQKVDLVLAPDDLPIQFYTYPQAKNNGKIYFRATDDANDRMFYEFAGTALTKILAEGIESYGMKSSYLFRPSVNDSGALAFKARLGERGQWDESNPDTIVLLTPSSDPKGSAYKITTVARDKDADFSSKFLSFGNTVSLSKSGLVSFTATTLEGKKEIVLFRDGNVKILAVEGQNGIAEIEQFGSRVNDSAVVLFRAKDTEGKRSLYIASEDGVKRLIGEGDDVMTDVGNGKILMNPNFPGIGGDVSMNERGDIVFYGLVVGQTDNKELGSAVFKLSPVK